MATNGLVVMTPTSIGYSGTSASINADGSVSFNNVTYVSGRVFTTDYDNYLISCQLSTDQSSGNGVYYYLYDPVTTTYGSFTYQELGASSTTVYGNRYSSSSSVYCALPQNVAKSGFQLYCFGPYLTQPTALRSVSVSDTASAQVYDSAATESSNIAFPDIGFTSYLGNMTGLLTVFGFNQ